MHSIQIRKTLFLILLTFIFALTGLAQSSQAESGQLRFVSKRPVEHLRLQVHNQAGALIHDSGLVAQSQLVWPLGDGLKAGLTAVLGAFTARATATSGSEFGAGPA
jgi:hypothetical protein